MKARQEGISLARERLQLTEAIFDLFEMEAADFRLDEKIKPYLNAIPGYRERLHECYAKLDRLAHLDALQTGSFKDSRDGKTYKSARIGNQTWMAENLNYETGSGSWCYDDSKSNCNIYGRLYDWETARKACPPGWHLPSDSEWTQLTIYLGDENVAGGKLKATTLWNSPNTAADNSSGFSALPGGARDNDGSFVNIGYIGVWWSSNEYYTNYLWLRSLSYSGGDILRRATASKAYGFSVRCIKD
ncbi:MAG: fibrobacter succinogenes major paralogous domain-containing protein [Bacteroidales bacterium]|nr:fibrobacter succinogenes major paralogous domain-containing protein [Bacteroidales bacterium]